MRPQMMKYPPAVRLAWAGQIRRDKRLKPIAHSVAAELCDAASNARGDTWIKKETIARRLNVSTRTVQRCLSLLVKYDYLTFTARPGTSNIWKIRFPATQSTASVSTSGQSCLGPQDSSVSQTYIEPKTEPKTTAESLPAFVGTSSEGKEDRISPLRKGKIIPASESMVELKIGLQLGAGGWAVLEKLKPWERKKFIQKARSGPLSASDLEQMRLLAARSEQPK